MTPIPPHDIVRAVRDELAVPGRYHLHPVAAPHRTLLQVVFDWIRDFLASVFHAIAAHIHLGSSGENILGDILIIGSLLSIAIVGARLLISFQLKSDRHEDAEALLPARNAQRFVRAAMESAAAGDYARAIRLLFTAATVVLDLRGMVVDDRSATINQLRQELRNRGSEAEPPFGELARAYTVAAYAEGDIDEAAWNSAREAYSRLSGRSE